MTTIAAKPVKRTRPRPWRDRHVFDPKRPTLGGLIWTYVLLAVVTLVSVGPFVWQLMTSFKGVSEDVYGAYLFPKDPTFKSYADVANIIPIYQYAWHSLIVAAAVVVGNLVFSLMAGYALGAMKFRGKKVVFAILLSVLLLPGEATIMSQYLTIQGLGLANSLAGVALPGLVGAVNVLLMTTACHMVPASLLEAATIDGATTWQKMRHIVWPNVRGMASVVAVFSFIGAWDDFLWPLIVLNDPKNYTLTVGMSYLNSTFGADPRQIAAGTIIALVPIIIVFASMQRVFFRGVEAGGVKG